MQNVTAVQKSDDALIEALRAMTDLNDIESLFSSLHPTDPVEALVRRS